MTARAFLDTNVLVYAVDNADPQKQRRAHEILKGGSADELVISTQVLSEFYVVVTRKLAEPLSPHQALAMVDELVRLPTVSITADLVRMAIAGSQEWKVSFWDALIVRAAEAAGCQLLLSEDLANHASYASVRVENPFTG